MPDLRIPAKAASGLSLHEMKEFVRNHFEDFVNRKKSEVALKNFSADFLDHDEPTGVEVGPEAAKKMMEVAYRKWPDLRVTVEEILAEGDKVVVRNSWTATEAETGQQIEFHGFVMWRFAHKKIVERWATITPPAPVKTKVPDSADDKSKDGFSGSSQGKGDRNFSVYSEGIPGSSLKRF